MTPPAAGRTLYDWWSQHLVSLRLLYTVVFLGRERRIRRRSLENLALEPGQRVLELGCGPGNAFPALRQRVGESGRVIGVDYSTGMVSRASDRISASGWENVHVIKADAARLPLAADSFDAVYSAMSLSAMADAESVLRAARSCLRSDGRMVVLDARPFQTLPWTILNPLIVPIAARLTNWYPDMELPALLAEVFGDVSVTDFNGGSIFIAQARSGGR